MNKERGFYDLDFTGLFIGIAVVSKWWDSAFEAIEEYQALKPGADEEAEAWAKMRKAGI